MIKKFKNKKYKRKFQMLGALAAIMFILIIISIPLNSKNHSAVNRESEPASAPATAPVTENVSHQIENVEVIYQDKLKAGCETYACTMLLKILGFDLTEYDIADNYLDCHYVFTDSNGTKYGPDMHSGFAGTAYAGWGVYAPSMAKSMNRYLDDQKSQLTAYAYENIPLEKLCEDYVSKDIPVMVWATTDMQEPYVFDTWTVNYVDENAKSKIGDTVSWYMHEHCLVLIGYDNDNYYFADSTAGKISVFKKELTAERYEQMGKQCIVVK